MDFVPMPKDKKILNYVLGNYSCKICNNILIQCISLSCGHNYCSYCLDMLGGMSRHCPQCSTPIKHVQPNNCIDQEIDELIHSCSESVQKAYATALDSRFQKTLHRSKNLNEEKTKKNCGNVTTTTTPRPLDHINNLVNKMGMNSGQSLPTALKSAQKLQKSARSGRNALERGARAEGLQNTERKLSNDKNARNSYKATIDVNKVSLLFGIYDHVLGVDMNSERDMAAGDFKRDGDVVTPEDIKSSAENGIDGLTNFTKRSEAELASLIKETDDILLLDDHIQKWAVKMKDALTVKPDSNVETVGIPDEKVDRSYHKVDDQLWQASSELLKRLRGLQQQRQNASVTLGSCILPPSPLPRSGKLDLEAISDDSDAEEYEATLENLQQCLKPTPPLQDEVSQIATSNEPKHDTVIKKDCLKEFNQANQQHCKKEPNEQPKRSSRKCSVLDSIEESGNNYVKENIDFITQMRKYKEALMKIQNHEVETAAEIQQLLPTRSDDNRFRGHGSIAKNRSTCRSLPQSQLKPGSRNHSYSSRNSSPASNIPRRPMTASYEIPTSGSQFHSRQIAAVAPTKQYLKRARANPLYTAR